MRSPPPTRLSLVAHCDSEPTVGTRRVCLSVARACRDPDGLIHDGPESGSRLLAKQDRLGPRRRPGDRAPGRRNAQSTHSMLCRGPASSIRRITSSVTGGGAVPGSSTGVQTSRNQPSIPAGV